MFQIALLGCENSHADAFLSMLAEGKFPDMTAVGIYSVEAEAAQKLHEKYGTPIMERFDELVGKVDGILVTARDGKYHYPYAKPYLASGIPMFIDKPITCDGKEAVAFLREAKAHGVRLCGGSSCIYLKDTIAFAEEVQKGEAGPYGRVMGASVCAPIQMQSVYGGFYFYAQYLVQIMMRVFGDEILAVSAHFGTDYAAWIARYKDYDITASYSGAGWYYHISLYGSKACKSADLDFTPDVYEVELAHMHDLLLGKEMPQSYDALIRPVFVLNAIEKATKSGKWEPVEIQTV